MFKFFRNIYHNVQMIAEWVPVLWNNWDWDHDFLMQIIRYKISRMSKHIREQALIADWKERCAEMDECVAILDRIIENDYIPDRVLSDNISDEERTRLFRESDADEQRDIDAFFDLFKNKYRGWWE